MKFLIFSVLPLLVFINSACSSLPELDSTPAKDLKPIQADRQSDISKIRRQLKFGTPETNITNLTNERANYKGTEFEPEIEELMAIEYIKLNKHTDAGLSYLRAARSSSAQERRFKLCYSAGKAFEAGRDWERLRKGVDYCLSNFELPTENIRDLKTLRLAALEAENANPLEITKAYVELMASAQGEAEARFRGKALKAVELMSQDQLKDVVGDNEYGALRGHAAYRLAQIYLSQRDTDSAKSAFTKVIQYLPETELAEISQKKIQSIGMATSVNPSTIGAVLPLSGKHAGIGQKLLRGLQMGLGLDGESETSIRLAVIDSEGNPDMARRGVEKLVQDDNVVAITGSLLSKTANAVADQAQVMGVPNIALSQKSGLTRIGENVFRFGMTSEMQVRYLVKRCMKDFGMRRFAIIYPNDKFGVEYANLFWDEVLARGGEIRAAQSYDPEEVDFSGPVQRLVGLFYQEERQEEVRWNSKLQAERKKGLGARARWDEDVLGPVVDFDAVFVPDGIKALGQISAMLSFHGVKGSKIIGPNLWNNNGLAKRIGNSTNQIIFVDGPPLEFKTTEGQNFVNRYRTAFNEDPGPFEIQGFETGLLLHRALAENVRTRSDFRDRLLTMPPLQGVLGKINIGTDREFAKELFLYTVESGQIKVIN